MANFMQLLCESRRDQSPDGDDVEDGDDDLDPEGVTWMRSVEMDMSHEPLATSTIINHH